MPAVQGKAVVLCQGLTGQLLAKGQIAGFTDAELWLPDAGRAAGAVHRAQNDQ